MDCALWLNRRKIFSADEISANFDIAAIRGYFLGGSLILWLKSHGGADYAAALARINHTDPELNHRLTEIFTQKRCEVPVHKADEQLIRAVDLFRGNAIASTGSSAVCTDTGSFGGSFRWDFGLFNSSGSFSYGSWNYSSYRYNLLNYGSYNISSFKKGSFSWAWNWEWEWRFGSFRSSSFRIGSFNYGSWSALGSYMFGYGSFAYGLGSFRYGSFPWYLGSFKGKLSYGTGSFAGLARPGSFNMLTADKYDEIMYRTLGMCPLNRFGYGIHLI